MSRFKSIARPSPVVKRIPVPGSAAGTQKRLEFIHDILTITGDTRLLWVPLGTDTTASTTVDLNSRTITWDATLAGRYTPQGSGYGVTFNGTSNYGTVPDAANLSFVPDSAFSVFAWVTQTASAADKMILAKDDTTTGATQEEWRFYLSDLEKLFFNCIDDSVPARIGRSYNTALGAGDKLFVAGTYSGSGASTGINSYNAGLDVDDTDDNNGVYVAMEDKTSVVYIGAMKGASAVTSFFNGTIYTVGLCAKALSASEVWALKQLGNAYFNLSI